MICLCFVRFIIDTDGLNSSDGNLKDSRIKWVVTNYGKIDGEHEI